MRRLADSFLLRLLKVYDWVRPAVFIYSIPKTGTSSIFHSLRKSGYKRAYHLHNFFPTFEERISERHKNISYYYKFIMPQRKIKMIACLREPLAQAISDFFEMNREYIEAGKGSCDDLINMFLDKPDHNCLSWFDKNMKRELGIDIYAYVFDCGKQFISLQHNSIDLLVLKLETDDAYKEKLVREFLNFKGLNYRRSKLASEKNERYNRLYKEFKQKLELYSGKLDFFYNSKYARHFYTENEIAAFRNQWEHNWGRKEAKGVNLRGLKSGFSG